MDETTSELDSLLERKLREATARVAKGRASVVIARWLSTVQEVALILVLMGGRVVERLASSSSGWTALCAALYREQVGLESEGGLGPAFGSNQQL